MSVAYNLFCYRNHVKKKYSNKAKITIFRILLYSSLYILGPFSRYVGAFSVPWRINVRFSMNPLLLWGPTCVHCSKAQDKLFRRTIRLASRKRDIFGVSGMNHPQLFANTGTPEIRGTFQRRELWPR